MKDSSKVSFLRVHRATLLVSVLLVASIAVSVYFGSLKTKATRATVISDSLMFSIELNKTEFVQQDENVTVWFSLMNNSNKTITALWGSYYAEWGQRIYFDYYIVNANGTKVYQYSHERGYLASTVEKVLNPGDQIANFYNWYQICADPSGDYAIAPKGTYSVAGNTRSMVLTVDGQVTSTKLETPVLNFTIK